MSELTPEFCFEAAAAELRKEFCNIEIAREWRALGDAVATRLDSVRYFEQTLTQNASVVEGQTQET